MGIECLWDEDGFHLARLGTNWEQGWHNFACTILHNFVRNFAQSVLLVSTTAFKPLRENSFSFPQCLSWNYDCKFHQVIFLHTAFQGFSTWMTLASCWEMSSSYTRLHMEQKHCRGMRRFSFYLGINFKGSFLKQGFDWRFLEDMTDLHSASLCRHFMPKIICLCVCDVSTTSELQGANFC